MVLKIHSCFIAFDILVILWLYQALVARLIDVNANTGTISGVLVTVGDLARVVSKFLSFAMLVFYICC